MKTEVESNTKRKLQRGPSVIAEVSFLQSTFCRENELQQNPDRAPCRSDSGSFFSSALEYCWPRVHLPTAAAPGGPLFIYICPIIVRSPRLMCQWSNDVHSCVLGPQKERPHPAAAADAFCLWLLSLLLLLWWTQHAPWPSLPSATTSSKQQKPSTFWRYLKDIPRNLQSLEPRTETSTDRKSLKEH